MPAPRIGKLFHKFSDLACESSILGLTFDLTYTSNVSEVENAFDLRCGDWPTNFRPHKQKLRPRIYPRSKTNFYNTVAFSTSPHRLNFYNIKKEWGAGAVLPRTSDNNIVLGAPLLKRGGHTRKNIIDVLARTFVTGEWILGVPPGTYDTQPQLRGNVINQFWQVYFSAAN